MKAKKEVMATFSLSLDRNYRNLKKPPFEDVVRELWSQIDELGGDYNNALLVPPRGTRPRQALLALKEIHRQNRAL